MPDEPRKRTQLGVAERDAVWASTLNKAEYRWDDSQQSWVVRFKAAPDWHTPRPGVQATTVFSQAGERFVEVV